MCGCVCVRSSKLCLRLEASCILFRLLIYYWFAVFALYVSCCHSSLYFRCPEKCCFSPSVLYAILLEFASLCALLRYHVVDPDGDSKFRGLSLSLSLSLSLWLLSLRP